MWSDRIALVTGSGRGIGRATAELLAERGCRVVVTARTPAEIEATGSAIAARVGPDRVKVIRADVGDVSSIRALFTQVRAEWGHPSLLVNNAALGFATDFLSTDPETFDRVMAVNVRGTYFCSQEFFRAFPQKQPGAIVNLSSLGGLQGTEKFPGLSAYVASKFAVVGLTEALAVEGRSLGIRVNGVAPGAVDTEMLRRAAPHLRTRTLPMDIARVIVDLCDETKCAEVTGRIVPIHSNE